MPNQEYGRQRRNGEQERRRYEARERGWEDSGEGWEDDDTLEERAFGGYPDYRRDRYERQQRGEAPFREGRSYRRGAGYADPTRTYPGGDYPHEQRGDEFGRREEPYAPSRYGEAGTRERYGRPGFYDAQHHGGLRQNYQREEARRYGADWGQGRGYTAGGYGYGEGEYAPGFHGQPGRAQGQGFDQDNDNEFEPDYREWRRQQISALDDDYRAYRSERQQKFSDDFETYRKNKTKSAGSTGSSASSNSAKSSS